MTDPERHEQFVREYWPGSADYLGSGLRPIRVFTPSGVETFKNWSAAYDFTVQRRKQIAEVEEEIAFMQGFSAYENHSIYGPARKRILTRLESALADLKKGLK